MKQSFKELLYIHHSNTHKLKHVLECAYSTAWKKVNNPLLLTVKDLFAMEDCGIAAVDEILEAIRKEQNEQD